MVCDYVDNNFTYNVLFEMEVYNDYSYHIFKVMDGGNVLNYYNIFLDYINLEIKHLRIIEEINI